MWHCSDTARTGNAARRSTNRAQPIDGHLGRCAAASTRGSCSSEDHSTTAAASPCRGGGRGRGDAALLDADPAVQAGVLGYDCTGCTRTSTRSRRCAPKCRSPTWPPARGGLRHAITCTHRPRAPMDRWPAGLRPGPAASSVSTCAHASALRRQRPAARRARPRRAVRIALLDTSTSRGDGLIEDDPAVLRVSSSSR